MISDLHDPVIWYGLAPPEDEEKYSVFFLNRLEPHFIEDFAGRRILGGSAEIGEEILVLTDCEPIEHERQHRVFHPLCLDAAAEHQVEKSGHLQIHHRKPNDPIMAKAISAVDYVSLKRF